MSNRKYVSRRKKGGDYKGNFRRIILLGGTLSYDQYKTLYLMKLSSLLCLQSMDEQKDGNN